MFLEMQIFAFRDRLRILPKTSRGIFFKILDFSSMFYTDFVHRNDFQCKKINNIFWKCNFFIENYKLITLNFFWNMTWPWKLPLRVHHDIRCLRIVTFALRKKLRKLRKSKKNKQNKTNQILTKDFPFSVSHASVRIKE